MFGSIGRAFTEHGDRASDLAAIADRIARSLLEIDVPGIAGVEIGVRAAPARIVGGDYLDVIVRPEEPGAFTFAIGDASGKSLPAALKAMMLKYLVRGLVRVLGADLASIVRRTNEVVCEDIEPDSYITLAIGTLSADRRTASFAVAGHDPALVWRHATRTIDELPPGGILLGFNPQARYAVQSAPIEPGDVIVLYTDGFTEAKSPDGEQFTLARVKDGIARYAGCTAQELADALFEEVEAYGNRTRSDDTTIVVVRVVD